MATQPTPQDLEEVDALLRRDELMRAVALFRERTGASLAEASRALAPRVEAIRAEASRAAEPPPAPAAAVPTDPVPYFLASAFGRGLELVARWRSGNAHGLMLARQGPPPGFDLVLLEGTNLAHQCHARSVSREEIAAALRRPTGFEGAAWAPGPETDAAIAAIARRLAAGQPVAATGRNGTQVHTLRAAAFEEAFAFHPRRVPAEWLDATAAEAPALPDDLEETIDALRAAWRPDARGEVALPPLAAPVLWAQCRKACGVASMRLPDADSFFGDLEAQRPAARGALAAEPAMAAELLAGVLSVPWRVWWVAELGRGAGLRAGALAPHEVRFLARHAGALAAAFAGSPTQRDAEALLGAITAAAEGSAWVVLTEPEG